MPSETSSARTLARRLVLRDAAGGGDPHTAPDRVVAACTRASEDLERWVGPAGCHALFARALAQARATHPALAGIRLRQGPPPRFEHVEQSVGAFGADAVALALEDVLVALLALLGRMVGEDIAERLLAGTAPARAPDATSAAEHAPDHAPEPGATPDDGSSPLDAPADR